MTTNTKEQSVHEAYEEYVNYTDPYLASLTALTAAIDLVQKALIHKDDEVEIYDFV